MQFLSSKSLNGLFLFRHRNFWRLWNLNRFEINFLRNWFIILKQRRYLLFWISWFWFLAHLKWLRFKLIRFKMNFFLSLLVRMSRMLWRNRWSFSIRRIWFVLLALYWLFSWLVSRSLVQLLNLFLLLIQIIIFSFKF